MKKFLAKSCLIFAAILVSTLALSLPAFAASSSAGSTGSHVNLPRIAHTFKHACAPARPGYYTCLALVSTTAVQPPSSENALAIGPNATAPGESAPYSPADFATAYNLPTSQAVTQTVAIVDAMDDPNAESDMATYRSQYNLPACTSASGCFTKVDENGGTNYPTADAGWSEEISLDLDMVSAICNNCNILLVEANSASTADLGQAVQTAVSMGATEISNSYGGAESSDDPTNCSTYYNQNVVVTASSGDSGPGVESPADCPNVVAVGGTTLNSDGSETAWNTSSSEGAGGGCSSYIPAPSWENTSVTNCSNRAVADVSADADPATGAYIYDSYQQNGWMQIGGTSEASPIIAAVFALAGGSSNGAATLWNNYQNGCLNAVDGQTYEYQAGLGTPNGLSCF